MSENKKGRGIVRVVLSLLLLAAACVLAFRNGLNNWFAFDDHLAIVDNADTAPDTPYSQLLQNDIWGKALVREDSHRSFRPLLILVFKLIRTAHGLSPFHFRVVSLALHVVATFFVYWLSYDITLSEAVAFGSALLFATHPVHVESVTAVVNLAEPFSCIAYISAYLLFLRLYQGPAVADLCFKSISKGATSISSSPEGVPLAENKVDDSSSNWDSANDKAASNKSTGSQNRILSNIFGGLLLIIIVFIGILLKESALSICGMFIAKIGIDAFSWAAGRSRSSSKSGLFSLLSFVVHLFKFAVANLFWVAMPFLIVVLYVMLRDIVITGSIATTTIFSIRVPSLSLSNSYLNNSQLLRRAENPFAELVGDEKVMSLMVSPTFNTSHFSFLLLLSILFIVFFCLLFVSFFTSIYISDTSGSCCGLKNSARNMHLIASQK